MRKFVNLEFLSNSKLNAAILLILYKFRHPFHVHDHQAPKVIHSIKLPLFHIYWRQLRWSCSGATHWIETKKIDKNETSHCTHTHENIINIIPPIAARARVCVVVCARITCEQQNKKLDGGNGEGKKVY